VPDIKLDKKVETDFINQRLLNEWNYSPDQVREQMKNRFYVQPAPRHNPPTPSRRTAPHDSAGSKAPARETAFDRAKRDRNK